MITGYNAFSFVVMLVGMALYMVPATATDDSQVVIENANVGPGTTIQVSREAININPNFFPSVDHIREKFGDKVKDGQEHNDTIKRELTRSCVFDSCRSDRVVMKIATAIADYAAARKLEPDKSSFKPVLLSRDQIRSRLVVPVEGVEFSPPKTYEPDSLTLQLFGRPTVHHDRNVIVHHIQGWRPTPLELYTERARKRAKEHRLEKDNSLDFWLARNGRTVTNPEVFDHSPVSYVATFNGKNDVATLRLARSGSAAANKEALEFIHEVAPFTTPPNDLPYERGLFIRFSGSKMKVDLGPHHFN